MKPESEQYMQHRQDLGMRIRNHQPVTADDLRLKIDFEEDWEHAQVIFEALGPDEWDWQRIADLLDSQPALRKRMAVLNRAKAQI